MDAYGSAVFPELPKVSSYVYRLVFSSYVYRLLCGISLTPSLNNGGCARYGTIPVVRKTGGLNDTVFDVDDDKERAAAAGMETNGYSFEGTDPGALDYGLNRYALNFALLLCCSRCVTGAVVVLVRPWFLTTGVTLHPTLHCYCLHRCVAGALLSSGAPMVPDQRGTSCNSRACAGQPAVLSGVGSSNQPCWLHLLAAWVGTPHTRPLVTFWPLVAHNITILTLIHSNPCGMYLHCTKQCVCGYVQGLVILV